MYPSANLDPIQPDLTSKNSAKRKERERKGRKKQKRKKEKRKEKRKINEKYDAVSDWGGKRERKGMAYRGDGGCRDSYEPAFTIRNRSMEAATGETTARKEEKKKGGEGEKRERRAAEVRRERERDRQRETREVRLVYEEWKREREKEKPRVLSPDAREWPG